MKKSYDQSRQLIKKQRHYFANKGPSSQNYGFSNSQVWMWELDYKENWALKNWRFWTLTLEKTLESPLDCKEFKPVHPKGNQSWVFIGRTDDEAESPNTFATWCEELTHWKRPWCLERMKPEERDDRGWGGWVASPTRWTWVWVSSGSWWCTGKPVMLQSIGSDTTEQLNWGTQRLPTARNHHQLRLKEQREETAPWKLSETCPLLRGQELYWWSNIILIEIQPKASTQPWLIFPLAYIHHQVPPLGGIEQVNKKRTEVMRTWKFSFLGPRTEW